MKKRLLILAVAGLALASCSNDEVVESVATSDANAISFRPLVSGATRALDQTTTTLQGDGKGFYVTAKYNASASQEGGTDYFGATTPVHYTYKGGATNGYYTSDEKYYWPSEGYLNFYAFAPAVKTDEIERTAYNIFTITPNNSAASQEDFIYAVTYDGNKSSNGTTGVTLTFHHAESKVSIQAKNTSTLDFTINAVTLYQVSTSGKFTYTSNAASITDSKLNNSTWDTWTGSSAYAHTPGTTAFAAGAGAASIATDMILVPQTIAPVSAYASASADAALASTGSFIKVQLKAKQGSYYVLGGESTWVEAIWPLPAGRWDPGYHYTYTVDLAGGGYSATNKDADTDLDPLLEGAEIKFVSVTVDSWTETNYQIGNMVFAKGGPYSVHIPETAGTYYITITGLTSGDTPTVTGTGQCTDPSCTGVGTSGTTLVTCNVTAGTGTSVITVDNDGTGAGTATTVINLIQP